MMMATQLGRLWSYHQWAWRRTLPSLCALPTEEYRRQRPFFWETLHHLTVHSLAADWLWLERGRGRSPDHLLDPADFATRDDILQRWSIVWDDWDGFLRGLDDQAFTRPIAYRTTKGQPRQLRLADLVQHVVNHGTEHRSQLTPLLYQLGQPTESLDYMLYCLEMSDSGVETKPS